MREIPFLVMGLAEYGRTFVTKRYCTPLRNQSGCGKTFCFADFSPRSVHFGVTSSVSDLKVNIPRRRNFLYRMAMMCAVPTGLLFDETGTPALKRWARLATPLRDYAMTMRVEGATRLGHQQLAEQLETSE
jgi:hypothetical protein